ncbi:MAG TPA: RNA polymerase sigma factor [Noviherbaspirillum sp.]|uniref:RNA polymerase sigma factor n=1 Tax=Noviherbaspirillum sp. TaxID=1926288 RepID=UPI002D539701|nr:RNA polymerase sigma factor [Noviherbaspirillum sp.]HYD97675.1 RNA polymerase sigma factor [Noviherbaspirillum sp.]
MQAQNSRPDFHRHSDAELVACSALGDHRAFEVMMRRYNRALYRTARSIVKDDAEAEDILQDSYLLAYRNLDRFRGDASLATWLTRIVVNEALGRIRKNNRRAQIIQIVPESQPEEDTSEAAMNPPVNESRLDQPEHAAMRADTRRLIESGIDALPDNFRTVFVLRAVEELSVEQTAAALDIPEATVRSRYFRARSMLREALAREFDQALETAFSFDGARCDRIVAGVLARL